MIFILANKYTLGFTLLIRCLAHFYQHSAFFFFFGCMEPASSCVSKCCDSRAKASAGCERGVGESKVNECLRSGCVETTNLEKSRRKDKNQNLEIFTLNVSFYPQLTKVYAKVPPKCTTCIIVTIYRARTYEPQMP